MDFFNRDGSKAEMCGNGLRCAALFCFLKMNTDKHVRIATGAGLLDAWILGKNIVKIKIPMICRFKKTSLENDTLYYGNTGVPHIVKIVENTDKINVLKEGKTIVLLLGRRF